MSHNLVVQVPEELYKAVKIKMIEENRTIKDFLTELILRELDNEKAPVQPTK